MAGDRFSDKEWGEILGMSTRDAPGRTLASPPPARYPSSASNTASGAARAAPSGQGPDISNENLVLEAAKSVLQMILASFAPIYTNGFDASSPQKAAQLSAMIGRAVQGAQGAIDIITARQMYNEQHPSLRAAVAATAPSMLTKHRAL